MLRAADRSIRDKIRPRSRLQFLEEIYNVREAEERLISRQTDYTIIVVLGTKTFYTDKRTVKQPSYLDIFDQGKWATTSGPIGCAFIDQKNTQSVGPSASDWIYAPDANTSLASFIYFGGGNSHQDHRHSLFNPGQHAIPFHVKHSQPEPGVLESSSFMGNTDCISQFTYWSEGANDHAQREQDKTENHVSASRPPEHTMAETGRVPRRYSTYPN
jgi:hypothetical protein